MSEEKRDLKIKLIDDKGKYYEVISTEQFNIQEELNKEIKINIKYKEVLDKIKEYIKENTRYYDKELGLVEMMGAGETRTPVVYLYGLLELLEEIE